MQLASYDPSYDPAARAPGQHERTTVRRLRMRTLVALGILAVATAALGRTFGLRNLGFLGSEIGLLVGMFVILRYVLPLAARLGGAARGAPGAGSLCFGGVCSCSGARCCRRSGATIAGPRARSR